MKVVAEVMRDVRRTDRSRLAAVLALVGAAWLLAGVAIRLSNGGQVLPGTTVAGLELGGMGEQEARRRLMRLRSPDRTVTLTYRRRRFTVTSRAAGLAVDPAASARRAVAAGRGGFGALMRAPAAALGFKRRVEPVYSVNVPAVDRIIAIMTRHVGRPPFAGGFSIDPATLEPRVRPPRAGRVLDRRATRNTIARSLGSGSPRQAALPVRVRRAPSVAAVQRVADSARAYAAAGPLVVTGAGPAISVDTGELVQLLDLERVPSAERAVRLGVDRTSLRRLVGRLARQRERPPRDAELTAPAAPVVVEEKGALTWQPRRAQVQVRPARSGRSLERRGAERAIAAAIRAGDHHVELPWRTLKPRIGTDDASRVRSLIGTFTTRFACCEPRAKNIRLIAQAVDRTSIAAGERFSLNDVAGERTRERGFVPAPFIADGEIVPSVGGGVSQFSTTMYNAAYFAGLQLDAHQPHSFYIDRYPAGREATLDWRSIDLVWTNDTQAPVLIRASSTPTSVTVSLFGANGGRRVRAETGDRRPVAGKDFAITVTRVVRYSGGRQARQAYTTTYEEPPEPE